MKAARLPVGGAAFAPLVDLLKRSLSEGVLDAVMIPVAGPDGRSWPWILAGKPERLEGAVPLPPVMQVQGARVLMSLAGAVTGKRIAAVMRPCEYRAAVELSRLQQLDLDGVIVLGVDCPGSGRLADWRSDGEAGADGSGETPLRPACGMCTEFTGSGDVRVVPGEDGMFLEPLTAAGGEFLESLGLTPDEGAAGEAPADPARTERALAAREKAFAEIAAEYSGLDGLVKLYSGCIGCRNCRDVCPICYCRLCFIDSKDQRLTPSQHISRSTSAGSARLTPGTLLFHIGRMAHMSMSCTGCGMCEDACPSGLPVATLMSMVSARTGSLFGYAAGEDPDMPAPLGTYREDELHEFED